jgi:cation diffusion facilitator CzcD-associated flavoprotein CzcO
VLLERAERLGGTWRENSASAVQFIPEIQPEVAELQVYQRTAPWIVPRRNAKINPHLRRLFQRFPPAMKLSAPAPGASTPATTI